MLSAKAVQEMLGVDDCIVIAHGYTFDRNTVDIWFANHKLKRGEYIEGKEIRRESHEFDPSFFAGIKRFYRTQTDEKLVELFQTFGGSLPLTGES